MAAINSIVTPCAQQTRTVVTCRAQKQELSQSSAARRSSLAMLVAAPFLLTRVAEAALPAVGKSPEAREQAQSDRKAALRQAAQQSKESGKATAAFDDSQYAVSEDKSPNVHTRQEEGLRKGQ